jgi:hypothetical protein
MLLDMLISLIIGSLAVNCTVECIHHSKLFSRLRALLEVTPDNLVSQVVACPYCLSFHVGYIIIFFTLLVISGGFFVKLAIAPVLWLAIVRGAQLINDVLHAKIRTPKIEDYLNELKDFKLNV